MLGWSRRRQTGYNRPVGGVEKLLAWDLGLGIDHPDFQHVYLSTVARDPVNFDMVSSLSDHIKDLRLGKLELLNALTWILCLMRMFSRKALALRKISSMAISCFMKEKRRFNEM